MIMKTKNLLPFCTLAILIVLGSGCTPTPTPDPLPTPNNTLTGCFITATKNAQGRISTGFEYNGQHRLTKIISYDGQTGNQYAIYNIEYNTIGKIVNTYDSYSQAPTAYNNRVSYDTNNNPTLIESISTATNLVEFKVVMTYDANNRLIKKEHYRLNAAVLALSQTVVLRYTTDAYRPTQVDVSFVTSPMTTLKYIYTYDANHNLLSSVKYKSATATTPYTEHFYTYDSKNTQKKALAAYMGLLSGYEENYHNFQWNSNNIVTEIIKQYSSIDGTLMMTDNYNYAHIFNSRDYPISTTTTVSPVAPGTLNTYEYICD
jgi:YD repeat-containing protein